MKKLIFTLSIMVITALPARTEPAPEFTLPDASGQAFALSRQKGKIVLLSFWAGYCKPCLAEMPMLENLRKTYGDSGLMVAGICIDTKRSQAKAREIAVKQRVSYPILYDLGQKAMMLYKVGPLPSTFLIDKRGNIRYHFEGFTEKTKAELAQKIKLLLAELKAPPVVYFTGIECKGKAAGLKGQADSVALASIPEKYKKLTFDNGSPAEADYA
ncbi:TlpA family protein disulfide reductase [candidate division TA06 bacterium]|uniref:TlpA family protein disulfide reductase n=1 Tax=candidate division TA06 bacterium TaxID=2250710 RepID=A0A933IBY4_UNCT6|nr:TlpA family protein disulfide reductase [candidate division TA06 bacterium]